MNCHDKSCNVHDHCEHCLDWTDEKLERVRAFHENLASQHQRKACSKSSFSSGFSTPSVLSVPFSNTANTSLFDNVDSTISASWSCVATTSPSMTAKPDVSLESFSGSSDKPSGLSFFFFFLNHYHHPFLRSMAS